MQLELTIEEVNTILSALGKQPYAKVSALVGNIHRQANEQLQRSNTSTNIAEHSENANVELTKQNA